MPPDFEKKLEELGIPYEKRGRSKTVVDLHPPYPQGIDNSETFSNLLLRTAKDTDARLVSGEGDHMEFGPKKT